MSEVRSVSVHLDADVAGYIAKMQLAGKATDEAFGRAERSVSSTNRSLDHTATSLSHVDAEARKVDSGLTRVDNGLRKVDTDARKVDTSVNRVNQRLSNGRNELDRYSGRLELIGHALAILGPGLVPIAAVGIPAALGLTSALGAMALGAGTTALAVHGLGTAVDALNKFALDPSETNLKAVHTAMAKLPPDARAFARELFSLNPELQKLRESAASGLFPGLLAGLQAVERDGPIVNRILHSTGTEIGSLAARAGQSLGSPQWRDFLRFVEHEGPPSLEQVGQALGHVTHGVAELVMAGAPLEHGFLGLVLRGSVNFDQWASGAKDTQWLRDLIAYIDANGPRVEHFLGDTADLLVNIVRAAAPLGGPVLNSLDLIAKVLNTIVSSPAGPTILATVSALSLLSRGQALFGKVAEKSWYQAIAGAEGYTAKLSAARVPLTRGAVALGGFALAATGAADSSKVLNIASLAMAGSIAGPWGAAVGAGVGVLEAFTHHQDNSAAATTDFTTTLNAQTGAITENTRAQVANVLQQDGAFEAAKKLGIGLDVITSAALGNKQALAEVNGQLAFYLEQTRPGYTAGGSTLIPPEQVKAAGDLSKELDKVGGNLRDDQSKTRDLAAAMDDGSKAANRAKAAHHRLALELKAERQAAKETAQQFLTLGDDVDNTKVSLDKWIHQLQQQATALENFGTNAKRAADKGLRDGLIKQLEQMGPAGALRMRQLANATQSEIAKANRAWDAGQHAAKDYQSAVAYIANHPPTLSVNGVPQSIHELRLVQEALRAIHDKTVRITTVRTTGGRTLAGAGGGTVPGPRTPYGDKVFIHAAPGEEIITNRHGEADRFRADRAMGRIPSYADGGTVPTHVTRTPSGLYAGDSGVGAAARGASTALHGLRLESQQLSKQLDAERQQRQALAQERQQLVSSVRDQFRGDIFGVTPDGGVWTTGATSDPAILLRQQIRDARTYRADIQKLRRRGLRGGALAQVQTLDEAEQAMGLSRGELREISRLYGVRQRASQAAGATAGDLRFGHQLESIDQRIGTLHHDLQRVDASIRHHEHEAKKNADNTTAGVTKGINGSARKARRRGRPAQ